MYLIDIIIPVYINTQAKNEEVIFYWAQRENIWDPAVSFYVN